MLYNIFLLLLEYFVENSKNVPYVIEGFRRPTGKSSKQKY
jgi:hypothetical protein